MTKDGCFDSYNIDHPAFGKTRGGMLFEAAEDWDHRIDAWDGIESQHGLLADIWSLGFVSVPDEKKKLGVVDHETKSLVKLH